MKSDKARRLKYCSLDYLQQIASSDYCLNGVDYEPSEIDDLIYQKQSRLDQQRQREHDRAERELQRTASNIRELCRMIREQSHLFERSTLDLIVSELRPHVEVLRREI